MRAFTILLFLSFCSSFLQAQTLQTRTLPELLNRADPGWPLVQEWMKKAVNKVQVLPKTASRADNALLAAQVTTRSPMGAVIYETGGILVDGGWLRILGSGSSALDRDLMGWNKGKQNGCLLIADDVLGGFFALNGGAFGPESLGKVFYFAPDNLHWEPLDIGYSDFLVFCFFTKLNEFYADFRWAGWEKEIAQLNGNQGLFCTPSLFLEEGKDIGKTSRKPVPIEELWRLQNDIKQQLDSR